MKADNPSAVTEGTAMKPRFGTTPGYPPAGWLTAPAAVTGHRKRVATRMMVGLEPLAKCDPGAKSGAFLSNGD